MLVSIKVEEPPAEVVVVVQEEAVATQGCVLTPITCATSSSITCTVEVI